MALEPADSNRCQAEILSGSFMTLGPRRWERCTKKPTVVASEVNPGEDGENGSMSLCDSCLEMFKRKFKNWKKEFTIARIS